MQPGPIAPAARALGPDLARGFMLLFIALANTHYFLRAPSVLGGYPQDGTALDRATIWLLSTFVDGRAFPMFGLLFGYGVAQIARRHPTGTRTLLWRRSAVLIVVGLLDALLFYVGDILAAYGVLLLVGAFLIRWSDRWLLLIALLFFVICALPTADASTISAALPDPAMLPPDLPTMLTSRLPAALVVAGLGPIGFLCPFAVGLWAGRRPILERPVLLRSVAALGITAAVVGAQPIALLLAGVTTRPGAGTLSLLGALHSATGTLGGFGYAALVALIARRLSPQHAVVAAIAATGQRSMTCYLLQSVCWALLFTPFLLDLAGTLSVTATAAVAAVTWVGTVLAADWMRRRGERGPFERLIRNVTYGRAARTPAPTSS
ncbi:DUF418 domain-containing protein [Paractinoplanes rishiriensis]|uniref:DUF418 domain-containing protein n=1 Tax=Paractinoplanes rishiriensis TaxID=1050105 RepID=A0A919MUQ2_9ACTN|nr:DUF418 domain-containing protein [Actinoplanes rishiriensis]GIE95589.1 hypothetical protein Ari01nite_30540 [Actinoplanes rishiriensis]